MFSRSIRFARTGITASRVAWRPARCKAHGATRSTHSHEYIFFLLFFFSSFHFLIMSVEVAFSICFFLFRGIFLIVCEHAARCSRLASALQKCCTRFQPEQGMCENTLCVTPQESQLFSFCFSRLKYRSPFYSHSLDVVAGIWYPGSTPAMTVARVLLCPAINGLLVALYFGRHLHDIIVLLTCSRQGHT